MVVELGAAGTAAGHNKSWHVVVGKWGAVVDSIPPQRHRPGLRGGVVETTEEEELAMANGMDRERHCYHGYNVDACCRWFEDEDDGDLWPKKGRLQR